MSNFSEALMQFKVSMPNTKVYRDFLKELGYTKRFGSTAEDRPYLIVSPFKKWYWADSAPTGQVLRVSEKIIKKYMLTDNLSNEYFKE